MNKAQITVVEIPLLFLLLSGALIYFNYNNNNDNSFNHVEDYSLTINSFLNSIYYSNNFRKTIMLEDLSNNALTQNWTNISFYLNKSFLNYELVISNKTVTKNIFSCNATYNNYYSENIITIYNNSKYEFRKIKLGVCY